MGDQNRKALNDIENKIIMTQNQIQAASRARWSL